MFGSLSFFLTHRREGRPPAPPLTKLEKLEVSLTPHLSTSVKCLVGCRGEILITLAVKLQLLHVAVAVDGASLNPSNTNTDSQMEAESHASVLASTDPSVHAVKPKRMHNISLFNGA